jgi:hypothetical protein
MFLAQCCVHDLYVGMLNLRQADQPSSQLSVHALSCRAHPISWATWRNLDPVAFRRQIDRFQSNVRCGDQRPLVDGADETSSTPLSSLSGVLDSFLYSQFDRAYLQFGGEGMAGLCSAICEPALLLHTSCSYDEHGAEYGKFETDCRGSAKWNTIART